MGVYVFTPDSDRYDSLSLAESVPYEALYWHGGEALGSSWKPLSVILHPGNKPGEFPSLASHVPVFSERALTTLSPLIGEGIEALPLHCESRGPLFAIHVLDLLDCLDEANSKVDRDPDGDVMFIEKYRFRKRVVRGKHIFRWHEAPLYEVFVSEQFRDTVESAGLRGLTFEGLS